jgi:DNA repair protein RadC
MYESYQSSISQWDENDRPRAKLLAKGRQSLSDAELLAILMGSGSRDETAVELARRVLASVNNDLYLFGKINASELMKFKGIGEAKAITILAALELGRRRKEAEPAKKIKISSSTDSFEYLLPRFLDLPHEEFRVLFLSRSHAIIKEELISKGGIAGTVVDPRLIFKLALECLATAIVLSHNHPSGNLKPSEADIALTRKIREAGRFLEVNVLDHLIITDSGYYSFADEGLL